MSKLLTRIQLPGSRYGGLMDYGAHDAETMISQFRRHAADLRKQAEEVEQASDDQFQIDVIRGPYAEHHVREIQAARSPVSDEGEG